MSYIAKGATLAVAGFAVLLVLPATALFFMLAAVFAVRRRQPWEPETQGI